MQKKMEELSVLTTSEGMIEIQQSAFDENNPTVILISPDQVEILIAWLREAAKELTPEKQGSPFLETL